MHTGELKSECFIVNM